MAKEEKVKTKKPTKDEALMEMLDRNVNAFYMLGKAIEQNTMMYEALIVAINKASDPVEITGTPQPISVPDDTPVEPEVIFTKEDCKKVLINIVGSKGKDVAKEFLSSFGGATSISDLDEKDYEVFCRNGKEV